MHWRRLQTAKGLTVIDPALLPAVDYADPAQWDNEAAYNAFMRDTLALADKLQEAETQKAKYQRWQERYRYDPAAFAVDCFHWHRVNDKPTKYQKDILGKLVERKRVAIRGPHGLGKTAMASWAILWFSLTRDGLDWKIPTTASVWRQLTHYLWPEIHKWSRLLDWEKIGRLPFDDRTELQTQTLKLRTGSAFAVASDKHEHIEGAHADHIFYVFDEGKAIKAQTFDAAEGAFSGAGADTGREALALVISTPGDPNGRFYEIHARKPGFHDWFARHVKKDEVIQAGRMSAEWARARAQQWGEESAVYKNRVEGEFAAGEEDSIIPLAHIEAANERWRLWVEMGKPGNFVQVGVDVARQGADQTVLALRFDQPKWGGDPEGRTLIAIDDLRYYKFARTTETTGRVKGVLRKYGGQAVVDVIGYGSGVVDQLREDGFEVVAFSAKKTTDHVDASGELGFVDKRSASWWLMRELLDPENRNFVLALPPDDRLTGELAAPKWKPHSGGRIKVEQKEDIKTRIDRSTDSADAANMAVWIEEANDSEGIFF